MEDQINKKSIIFLFGFLILMFIFIYKGFILSGDEYVEELNNFYNFSGKQNSITLKKGGAGQLSGSINLNSASKKDSSPLQKKFYDVLQNLEDLKLSLGSLKHSIKNDDRVLIENFNKLLFTGEKTSTNDNVSKSNLTAYNITLQSQSTVPNLSHIKDIINEFQNTKNKKNYYNVDSMIETLSRNIESLRTTVKEDTMYSHVYLVNSNIGS
jgi:hypothetical protein